MFLMLIFSYIYLIFSCMVCSWKSQGKFLLIGALVENIASLFIIESSCCKHFAFKIINLTIFDFEINCQFRLMVHQQC